ncbi:hypothetical protein NDW01_21475 [Actinoallomurus sp. WRP6H-15]|nr:hypothetical protein [Actinoallomurus soli]MCO5970976.1 hypothetical protein [Actinoallomurus soli]
MEPIVVPSVSLCQVAGPAIPSTVSPATLWKPRTTLSVAGPNSPSAASVRHWSRAPRSRYCSVVTFGPVPPCRRTGYAGSVM